MFGNWRKSSYSGDSGGNCVELGQSAHGVLVRDTKDGGACVLTIPTDSWRAFLQTIK
ncbi:MAG TPA: DUF397 domain-containing protein [Trebonia sp.]|jgi:hypothetical protein|nr:DUF397 domain-containing protein [Trebonia sp.]